MTDRLLKLKEVEHMTSFKKTYIYAENKKGRFPAQIRLNGSARWKESDIAKWIENFGMETVAA